MRKLNHVNRDSLIAEDHYSYPCADCPRLGHPAPEKEMICGSESPRSPAVLHWCSYQYQRDAQYDLELDKLDYQYEYDLSQ